MSAVASRRIRDDEFGRSSLAAAILVLGTGLSFASSAAAQPDPAVSLWSSPSRTHGELHARVVQEAPPPRRSEVAIERPGPRFVWIKGDWRLTGHEWNWTDGCWLVPPRPKIRWLAARYEKVPAGTRYTPGHWSNERVAKR
jgi:hypothetical protein